MKKLKASTFALRTSALVVASGLVFGTSSAALADGGCPWNPAPVQGNEQPVPSEDVPEDIEGALGDLGEFLSESDLDSESTWWDILSQILGGSKQPAKGAQPTGGSEESISAQPGEDKTEKVGNITKGSSARTAELINAERRKAGLKAVPIKESNVSEAQACAVENVSRFARGDRGMRHCGYENLMASSTEMSPEALVQGWMNSPGHRDAMLNPKATSLGVGWATAPGAGYIYAANLSVNW